MKFLERKDPGGAPSKVVATEKGAELARKPRPANARFWGHPAILNNAVRTKITTELILEREGPVILKIRMTEKGVEFKGGSRHD